MSAYLLNRKHFAAVAAFVATHSAPSGRQKGVLYVYHPDNAAVDKMSDHYLSPVQVANILQQENNRSVNTRYGDSAKVRNITDAEVDAARTKVPTPGQMNGILRSYAYQSCDSDDWQQTRAHAVWVAVMQLVLEVVAKNELAVLSSLGHEPPSGSTYEWAS